MPIVLELPAPALKTAIIDKAYPELVEKPKRI